MFDTTIAGSLPKPTWLAEPGRLWAPWRLAGAELEDAKRDATLLALKLQEDCGIDVVTDGEQSRQHFVHGFVEFVDGIDFARKVEIGIRADRYKAVVPQVTGELGLKGRVHAAEAQLARTHTRRKLKIALPGPMTIVTPRRMADQGPGEDGDGVHGLLNAEARKQAADGVDVIQFDEPAVERLHGGGQGLGHRGAAPRDRGGRLHDRGPHLLRLWHQGQYRLEGDARRRMAPVRGDFRALARSRIGQVSVECRNSHVPISREAPRRQGRSGRRDRCRD